MPKEAPQFTDTVQPEPLRKVRPVPGFEEYAPSAAFGGGKSALGEAASQTAVTSGELIDYHKRMADDAVAQDLHARFINDVNELMYNPNKGYMLRHGRDAAAYNDEADPNNPSQTFQNVQQKYLTMAKSKTQKELIQRMTDDTITKATQTLRYHSFQETEYQAVAANSSQVGAISQMAVNDPMHIDDTIDDEGKVVPGYKTQIMAASYKGGIQPKKVLESLYAQVATKYMMDGQPQKAQEFLKTHPTDDATSKKLTTEIEKTGEDIKAGNIAQQYMDKHPGDPTAAAEDAKKNKDLSEKEQNEVVKKIQFLGRQKDSLLKQKTEQQFESVSQKIQEYAKQHPGTPFDAEKVVGEGVWNSLGKDAAEQKKMQVALKALGDPSTTGDVTVLNDFLTLPKDQIANMSKVDFAHDYLTKLNAPQMARARSVYDSFHKGEKSPATLKVTVPVAMLKDTMTRIYPVDKKLKFQNWPKDHQQTFNNLQANIEQEMEYYESVHGKEPNAVEIQKMIDTQLKYNYEQKTWFGLSSKTRPVANLKAGILDKNTMNAIEKNFPDLSEEQQFLLYQAKANGDKELFNKIAGGK